MSRNTHTAPIFRLDIEFKDTLQKRLFSLVKRPIEHALAFPRMNRAYADISRMADNRPFADKVLDRLNVSYDLANEDFARLAVPSGPVIVVANHPFGGIEGVILASLLRSVRCDVKFMANYLLRAVPEMRDLLICVNPFGGAGSVRENIGAMRDCLRWLKGGGMLVVFPAGEVSRFDIRSGTASDPAWNPMIARLIRRTGAPALPVFFPGSNSPAFHMAGMVHPLLRTALLPNELMNKGRKNIPVRVGDLISFEKLNAFDTDDRMTEYLRLRTYLLGLRRARRPSPLRLLFPAAGRAVCDDIIRPQESDRMADELRRIPPEQTLIESGDLIVLQAAAGQIPALLTEIGRLREVTFRAAGEGTGKTVDLDRFDEDYLHLILWNRAKNELAGAYRLGRTDILLQKHGARGIYTSTLFRYRKEFFERMGPALELGRSFIRLEYQRSYAALLLLWKGIGRFIVRNPRYRVLFGPVSMNDAYQAASKELIIRFLRTHRFRDDLAGYVRPRKPYRTEQIRGWNSDAVLRAAANDIDDVSELVSCIEKDRKGVPVLLRQYLKLGGELLGFNVDPAFGNVLDGLIMVDLAKTEHRMLERYLGKDGTASFLECHRRPDDGGRVADCA